MGKGSSRGRGGCDLHRIVRVRVTARTNARINRECKERDEGDATDGG